MWSPFFKISWTHFREWLTMKCLKGIKYILLTLWLGKIPQDYPPSLLDRSCKSCIQKYWTQPKQPSVNHDATHFFECSRDFLGTLMLKYGKSSKEKKIRMIGPYSTEYTNLHSKKKIFFHPRDTCKTYLVNMSVFPKFFLLNLKWTSRVTLRIACKKPPKHRIRIFDLTYHYRVYYQVGSVTRNIDLWLMHTKTIIVEHTCKNVS